MPQLPHQPPGKGMSQGITTAVKCPWCGTLMDLSDLDDQPQGTAGWGSQGLEKGALIECDKCDRKSKVVLLKQVTVIHLVADRSA